MKAWREESPWSQEGHQVCVSPGLWVHVWILISASCKEEMLLTVFPWKKILTITKQSHYCDSCLYKVRRGVRSPHFRARAFSQEYKRQISLSWESYLVKMAEEGEKGAVWQVDRIEWTWPRGMDLSAIDLVTNGVWRAWHRRSVSEDLTIPALSPGLSNSQ
jgi:hypothetical protein